QRDRLLEVVDGLFILGILVGLHAFVELIARSKLAAARGGQHRQPERHHCQHSYACFHCAVSLPCQKSSGLCWCKQTNRTRWLNGRALDETGGRIENSPTTVPQTELYD